MRWKSTLNKLLMQHNKKVSAGGRTCSFATQAMRREVLEQGFALLRTLGYKLPDVRGFKERHMKALGYAWEKNGLSPSTLQNRFSIFRTFATWIGKKGMIQGNERYVQNPQSVVRHLVTQTDKTWSGQKKSLEEKLPFIRDKDVFVAMQLELQRAFGLRMKEAALLRPHQADKGICLLVNWGTKGGRDRIVPIETDYQRDVLERAKSLLPLMHSSMIPTPYNFRQWRDHYYYICQEHGISRKDGITSHGLRHERLNEIYQQITGQASPVKQPTINAAKVHPDLDKLARQEIAEVAGHGRAAISSAYCGSSVITRS